jgi:hypothetical protein
LQIAPVAGCGKHSTVPAALQAELVVKPGQGWLIHRAPMRYRAASDFGHISALPAGKKLPFGGDPS